MNAIAAIRFLLWLLVAVLSLAGCAQEESLYLDWLAGSGATAPREEQNSFDAAAIVAHPGSHGFTPFVIQPRAGVAIVWMLRRRARLKLETFAPGPRELILEAAPYQGSAPFEIYLDGEPMARFEWSANQTASVLLPSERIPVGRHEIEIRLDESMQPSHELPGNGGLRSFGFAIRRIALVPEDGAPARIRERWLPAVDGSSLRLAGSASAGAARVWLLRDTGDGRRVVEREAVLAEAESFAWELPVVANENGMERFAVVESGSINWTRLGQSLPAAGTLERRNIVLITLDTTRRDALGSYRELDGSLLLADAPSPTPTLDGLAAESLFCRRAFSSAPVTAPTHASMFLSQPPAQHGLRVNGLPLPESSERSLVARLSAWGYRTSAFVSLGVVAEDAGFAQDFESFDGALNSGWWRYGQDLNAALFRWLENEQTAEVGPRFLWLHYSDPHKPYAVAEENGYGIELSWNGQSVGQISTVGRELRLPMELTPGDHRLRLDATGVARETLAASDQLYRVSELKFSDARVRCTALAGIADDGGVGSSAEYAVQVPDGVHGQATLTIAVEDLAAAGEIRRRYLAEVASMDAAIGEALDRLRSLGWLADALVAVVADHGEDLGAEDERFGHVEHLRPTLSSVGMFVHDPRLPGRVLEDAVSVVDLAPTLLGATGLAAAPGWSGRNLFEPELRARPLYLETFPPEAERRWRSLVFEGHKLDGVVDADGVLDGRLQLFDLASDPACRSDLLAGSTRPESLSDETWDRVLSIWTNWVGDAGAIPAVDPAMQERLRALGYVE